MTDRSDHPLRQAFRAAGRALGAAPARVAGRPDRAGKRLVAGHFDPAIARHLKLLAASRDTTVQALLNEALHLLFARHGISLPAADPRFAQPHRQRRRVPAVPR